MKTFLKYILLYITITIIFFCSLLIVSFIPKKNIEENVKESAEILYDEGEEVYYDSLGRSMYDNNSTDAIMLNLTYTIDENNRIESLIRARRNFVPGVTENIEQDMLGNLPYESGTFQMTKELLDTTNGKNQTSYEYTRYWHGYIVILRILLVFFNITTIRWITQIILLTILGILMYYLKKNASWKIAISVLFAFVATDLFIWCYTIQGMYVKIIGLLLSIFIANKKINNKNINMWLFISGGLTAYFDFLTTPLISVLLPIIVYTAVNNENKTTLKEEIFKLFKNLLAWGFGYLGLWASKWVIADVLLDMEIIKLSVLQIIFRIFGRSTTNSDLRVWGILNNVVNSLNYLVIAIYCFMYLYAFGRLHKCKKGYFLSAEKLPYYMCYIITIAWYGIVSQHSAQHFFFTYKTMLITVLSMMLIVVDDRNGRYIKEDKEEVKND